MTVNDLPVLVGASQLLDRDSEAALASTPLQMLSEVTRAAARDAGPNDAILCAIDAIALVEVLAWHPGNGPRLLAESVGCENVSAEYECLTGGETPVALINMLAERIYRGESEVALVAGSNNIRTIRNKRKAGMKIGWETGGAGKAIQIGETTPGSSDEEIRYGLDLPPSIYPIFENALRAARGLDLDQHRTAMGNL
ncbi:MAG: hypothetical protein NZ808_10390, partial [Myxococcota bacterium]|nr:hypothetical protein [Myxococcota bacterium]